MFSNMLSSISENIYDCLDDLVFVNQYITKPVAEIMGNDASSGIKLICNSLIYGFILYYAISYLLSHITFAQVEKPLQFIFKLLLCAIALNASDAICSGLIYLCSNISEIILELGSKPFTFDVSFATLLEDVLPKEYFASNSFSLFSFDGIIKTTITFGFLNLLISYAIRYILLISLIAISPFAILSLATNKSSSFFKAWFKNFIALLFLQIFVAVILLVCFILHDNHLYGFPSEILYLGMVYTLFKANSFVRDLIGGFSTDVNVNFTNISSMFKGGGLN